MYGAPIYIYITCQRDKSAGEACPSTIDNFPRCFSSLFYRKHFLTVFCELSLGLQRKERKKEILNACSRFDSNRRSGVFNAPSHTRSLPDGSWIAITIYRTPNRKGRETWISLLQFDTETLYSPSYPHVYFYIFIYMHRFCIHLRIFIFRSWCKWCIQGD